MLIYDKRTILNLREFGITIPLVKSRYTTVFEELCSLKKFQQSKERWHKTVDSTVTKEDLLLAHTEAYVESLYSDSLEREILKGFELIDSDGNFSRYHPEKREKPLSELFERLLLNVAGTYEASKEALKRQFAAFLGGGAHHAHPGFGWGFCVINDAVVAARKVQSEGLARHIWIIDTDAHKGDGTADMTQHDDTITTLSIHMANGWPLSSLNSPKSPASIPSTIDIPIASGEESLYLKRLEEGLHQLDSFKKPDLAIVLAGADPYEKDTLPSTELLQLTKEALFERDMMVYRSLLQRNIATAWLGAGGYGPSVWEISYQFLKQVLATS